MDENYLLVKFRDSESTDYTIEGLMIMTEEEWEKNEKLVKDYFVKGNGPLVITFPTNVEVVYETEAELLSKYKIFELNENELSILNDLVINESDYGYFVFPAEWIDEEFDYE